MSTAHPEWPTVTKPGTRKKLPEPPRFDDVPGQASVYDYTDEPEPSGPLAPVLDFPAQDEPPYEEEPPRRRIVLTPASAVRMRRVRWLWDTSPEGVPPHSHGRIPMHSLTIAAGGPGLGKSQFAIWMAAQITRGTLPGELFGSPRSVIYASTEDSWAYTIAPRLVAAGADMDRVFHIAVHDDETLHARLTLPSDISLLGEACETYSVALLVADPLLSMIDDKVDDYRAREVRAALEPLVSMADRYCFTILGLAHFTKSGAADPLSRIAGSGAFGQLVRAAVVFSRIEDGEDGEDRRVLSQVKNNLGREGLPSFEYRIQSASVDTPEGPTDTSRFVLGPESLTSVTEQMSNSGRTPEENDATNEAASWLRGHLTDHGGTDEMKTIKAVGVKEGYSSSALDRAKRKLKIKTKQTGFGKDNRSFWYLPEAYVEDD
ncbi:AAA family ATPase [Streptomyces sp. NPDC102365]|uniref:ATP-binding protein n=1 Tax=Streptomyces sp. NPDC102365 TaxID=3366162 RepID=UPI00382892C5